jgi:IS5 family transposase
LHSFHAPEIKCIGKGKASAPYELGVKASFVVINAGASGGQFVLHARAPRQSLLLPFAAWSSKRLTRCEIEI